MALCKQHACFPHSSANGRGGHFQDLAVVSCVAADMGVPELYIPETYVYSIHCVFILENKHFLKIKMNIYSFMYSFDYVSRGRKGRVKGFLN